MTNRKAFGHRFWSHVDARESLEECWEWTGATAEGYGRVKQNGRNVSAHRESYRMSVDDVPAGMWVLHRCDNPPCVNPMHLFVGTRQDNVDDMAAKGRRRTVTLKGEESPHAKLTGEQVDIIRADPRSQSAIAVEYGVSQQTISDIKRRRKWAHR